MLAPSLARLRPTPMTKRCITLGKSFPLQKTSKNDNPPPPPPPFATDLRGWRATLCFSINLTSDSSPPPSSPHHRGIHVNSPTNSNDSARFEDGFLFGLVGRRAGHRHAGHCRRAESDRDPDVVRLRARSERPAVRVLVSPVPALLLYVVSVVLSHGSTEGSRLICVTASSAPSRMSRPLEALLMMAPMWTVPAVVLGRQNPLTASRAASREEIEVCQGIGTVPRARGEADRSA